MENIKSIINEMGFYSDSINRVTNFKNDLGMDSLDVVELSVLIENYYNITIDDDSLFSVNTMEDLMIILENKNN